MSVHMLVSPSLSLSVSPAKSCRSCCNSGTLPSSLLCRHSGYLWQRYSDTLQHILLWPWLFVLEQLRFQWAVNGSSHVKLYISVCVCLLTGLDGDLLTVLPALSRHPSLKHLHLGKNFNIKNRCCRWFMSRFTEAICVCMRTQAHMHCMCQLEYTCLWFYFHFHERLPLLGQTAPWHRKLLMPAHPASSLCLTPWFLSAGFWMKSCRSWFNSYRRRNVWVLM